MALFTKKKTGVDAAASKGVGSVKSGWTLLQTDLTSDATGLDIGALTDADHGWVQVPEGATRLVIRARCTAAHTATATSPVVRIWGNWSPMDGVDTIADGTDVARLDTTDADGTGITVTIDADESTVVSDATYEYHNPTTWDGYDLRGARWVLVQVITAASITGGTADLQGLFLN